MKKLAKKSIIKFSIVAAVVVGSSISVYTYAESMKESNLKEEIVTEQKLIEKSISQLYTKDNQLAFTAEESSDKIDQLLKQLNQLMKKSNSLGKKNLEEVNASSQSILKKLKNNDQAFELMFALNDLFEAEVFGDEGFNQEVKVKAQVTIEKVDELNQQIQALNQSEAIKIQFQEATNSAKKQIEAKKAVDTWYEENKETVTEENYKTLEELVSKVGPETTKEEYKETLVTYKTNLEEKVAKEKAAKEKTTQEKTTQTSSTQSGSTNIKVSETPASSSSSQATTGGTTQATPAPAPAPAPAPDPTPAPAPAPRTDGFNFKGYHFDLSSFSGVGSVPQWTPYVYQWTDDPSHYLFEKASSAGGAVWNIGVGDTVVINGQTYTVFNVMRNVPNNDSAYGVLKSQGATVTWQTCELASANSDLAIWFAY